MKIFLVAPLLLLTATASNASDPLPETRSVNIEYSSPKAAYEALHTKLGVEFSRDDSGWTVAFDKSTAIIWSFAPSGDPSFPIVVKRVPIEKDGHLFIAMDVLCGGSKEACDSVVRRYTAINEQIGRDARTKQNSELK
jgi:hypothetical protein